MKKIEGETFETDVYSGVILAGMVLFLSKAFDTNDVAIGQGCFGNTEHSDYVEATINGTIRIVIWLEKVIKEDGNFKIRIHSYAESFYSSSDKDVGRAIKKLNVGLREYFKY